MAEKRAQAWTVAVGDAFSCTICPAKDEFTVYNDEYLNGVFPTKLAAVEHAIGGLEETRRAVALELKRLKRMRARLVRQQP